MKESAEHIVRSRFLVNISTVDVYNDIVLNCIHGDQRLYLVANSFKEINTAGLISPPAALDYVAK